MTGKGDIRDANTFTTPFTTPPEAADDNDRSHLRRKKRPNTRSRFLFPRIGGIVPQKGGPVISFDHTETGTSLIAVHRGEEIYRSPEVENSDEGSTPNEILWKLLCQQCLAAYNEYMELLTEEEAAAKAAVVEEGESVGNPEEAEVTGASSEEPPAGGE